MEKSSRQARSRMTWQPQPPPPQSLSLLGIFIGLLAAATTIHPVSSSPAPYNKFSDRVVGGGSATAGQFPYIVSLRSVSSGAHFCGGTIHTSRYVITAAHCVANKVSMNVRVVAGSTFLSSGGATYSVAAITSHPNYSAYTYLNDIALLKTSSSITYSEQVKALPITANFVEPNRNAVALGWGLTTVPGYTTDILQWITLSTITNTICKSMHGSTDSEKITDASLCTYISAGQGLCTGDSGGPLVYNNELVGVISWGVPCAQGKPDVYTRISSVFSWVKNVVG